MPRCSYVHLAKERSWEGSVGPKAMESVEQRKTQLEARTFFSSSCLPDCVTVEASHIQTRKGHHSQTLTALVSLLLAPGHDIPSRSSVSSRQHVSPCPSHQASIVAGTLGPLACLDSPNAPRTACFISRQLPLLVTPSTSSYPSTMSPTPLVRRIIPLGCGQQGVGRRDPLPGPGRRVLRACALPAHHGQPLRALFRRRLLLHSHRRRGLRPTGHDGVGGETMAIYVASSSLALAPTRRAPGEEKGNGRVSSDVAIPERNQRALPPCCIRLLSPRRSSAWPSISCSGCSAFPARSGSSLSFPSLAPNHSSRECAHATPHVSVYGCGVVAAFGMGDDGQSRLAGHRCCGHRASGAARLVR